MFCTVAACNYYERLNPQVCLAAPRVHASLLNVSLPYIKIQIPVSGGCELFAVTALVFSIGLLTICGYVCHITISECHPATSF